MLKLPVIPAGKFPIIQDGVQDGRQNVNRAYLQNNMTKGFSTVFYPIGHIIVSDRKKIYQNLTPKNG